MAEPHGQDEPEEPVDTIKRARLRLGEVRRALQPGEPELVPDQVRACTGLLEEAIACIGTVPITAASRELRREFESFRFELGVIRRLLDGGANFYRDWGRIVAGVASGYMPSGEPAPLTAAGSVSVKG
jgi:hypothetical protein